MNPVQKQSLNTQLSALNKRIDESIEAIEITAIQNGMVAANMMTVDGRHMLTPLLVAKAEVLHGQVMLNLKDR